MDLLTPDQAEDAAANALAELMVRGLARRGWLFGEKGEDVADADFVAVCRELLRGPLAEDYTRRPGGYCMRAPRDPDLYALSRYGARLVEAAYTARDAASALAEVGPLPPLSGSGTREEPEA